MAERGWTLKIFGEDSRLPLYEMGHASGDSAKTSARGYRETALKRARFPRAVIYDPQDLPWMEASNYDDKAAPRLRWMNAEEAVAARVREFLAESYGYTEEMFNSREISLAYDCEDCWVFDIWEGEANRSPEAGTGYVHPSGHVEGLY